MNLKRFKTNSYKIIIIVGQLEVKLQMTLLLKMTLRIVPLGIKLLKLLLFFSIKGLIVKNYNYARHGNKNISMGNCVGFRY
jgi:hypothetical protein